MSNTSPIQIGMILVPTNFSTESLKALQYAVAIARAHHARVSLLHVEAPVRLSIDYGYGAVERAVPDVALLKRTRARLQQWARTHVPPERLGQVCLRSGQPGEEILRLARELKCDLIILGARPRPIPAQGSPELTMEGVARAAPCPVMIVRRHEHDFLRETKPNEAPPARAWPTEIRARPRAAI